MATYGISEPDFIEMFKTLGPKKMAAKLGVNERNIFIRRTRIEQRRKTKIEVSSPSRARSVRPKQYPWRLTHKIKNGTVIVFSDCHYWPGTKSLMHKAVVHFCKQLKPDLVVANGDVIDAPTISKHSAIGWEKRPMLADEIENAKERLHEIEKATFKARKIWTLGNHDSRFETRIANAAPEYAKIHGVHLKDHFPNWEPCWQVWINDDVIVTHRWKSGMYAPMNNTKEAGRSIITGHLHRAQVLIHTDTRGDRYGVDTGCIADTDADAFVDYTEGKGMFNWRSGFCILTFRDGELTTPELVLKWDDDRVQFRGEIIEP